MVTSQRSNRIYAGRFVLWAGLCVTLITVHCFDCFAEDNTGDLSILEIQPAEFERKSHDIQARNQQLNIEKLMDLLEVRLDMTILDVGTGIGTNAFKFAERMQGTGKVYATDVDEKMIIYVAEEAQKKGIKNVTPILVQSDGWDPFYGEHKYDLILAFRLDNFIKEKVEYYSKFKKQLEEGGRLVVLKHVRLREPLSSDDIEDIPGFIHELANKPPESPFVTLLRPETRNEITRYENEQTVEVQELMKEIIIDLYRAMGSVDLLRYQFKKLEGAHQTMFTTEEEVVVKFLKSTLKDEIVLDNETYNLQKRDEVSVRKLNLLFLVGEMRQYLKEGNNFFLPPRSYYESRSYVVQYMDQAGYRLQEVYDSLGLLEVAMVFAPKDE